MITFKNRFNPEKLAKLKEVADSQVAQSLVGAAPYEWIGYLNKHLKNLEKDVNQFSQTPLDRPALYKIAGDKYISDVDFTLNVLAWGGMRRNHGALLFKTWEQWIHLIGQIRSGSVSREFAYKKFQQLRANGLLSGMGPAFFTKLIFFGLPKHDGYILDQWTGRSINFLLDEPLIKLSGSKGGQRVSDSNDFLVYSNFCIAIEELADLMPVVNEPRHMEEILFSWGGRRKGAWRTYLLENT